MGNDKRRGMSPTPPAPPSLSSSNHLRVRPKAPHSKRKITKNNSSKQYLKGECYSALLPALLIAGIWCLGCYVYLWIQLFESLHADIDDHGDHIVFNKKNDILAIRLEQFLTGSDASESDTTENGSLGQIATPNQIRHFNDSILDQMTDPNIANIIQSTLITQTGYPNLILGAYLEPPLPMDEDRMKLRTHTPKDLTHVSYPYQHNIQKNNNDTIQSQKKMPGACSQKGAQWIFPTFHPRSLDGQFESNVFKKHPDFDRRWELSKYCPVDADPFLPWIHDAVPSNDGTHVEFIISNKRRCNTDPKTFRSDLVNLEPQVALMQPIPVKRSTKEEEKNYDDALEQLWSPNNSNNQNEPLPISEDNTYNPQRYILGTSLEDADPDGQYTRFICRFHTVTLKEGSRGTNGESNLQKTVLGETLSNYPYNPEHANYRKRGSKPMLTSLEQGHDEQIWNSIYTIRCPVPTFSDDGNNGGNSNVTNNHLASIIASGRSVVHGSPSIYMDLVPIRTPTRLQREGFALPGATSNPGEPPTFDPKLTWGDAHVLPRIEASGRWTNIPICRTPKVEEVVGKPTTVDSAEAARTEVAKEATAVTSSLNENGNKTNFLISCVWASQSFSTRGQTTDTDTSTSDRLREFLAYHTKIAGFDHVYVYDNSDPSARSSLAAVTDLFPPHAVTRIPWPHRVCNNNRPMHANPGLRSSQIAAQNSCRVRYGPDTTWLASLDVDEYLIPTGKQNNIREWLEQVSINEKSTKILSFFQTRALPNVDFMVPYAGSPTSSCRFVTKNDDIRDSMCLMKDPKKTYMETYNCEPTTHPKPESWAWRAKKQIYRPEFVLNHFVHYPVVTRQILDKPLATSLRFYERAPFERRVDELTEGFLLHSKTTGADMTSKWQEHCLQKGMSNKKNSNCKVGIPSPATIIGEEMNSLSGLNGADLSHAFESTCYRHGRVTREWVPKLEGALHSLSRHVEGE